MEQLCVMPAPGHCYYSHFMSFDLLWLVQCIAVMRSFTSIINTTCHFIEAGLLALFSLCYGDEVWCCNLLLLKGKLYMEAAV